MGIQCVDCVKAAAAARRPVRSALGLVVRHGPPVFTIALIVINVAVYLYGTTLADGQLFSQLGLWPHYDVLNPYYWAGTEWWRWITSGFVHRDILHIGLNMLVLFQFGGHVEALLGRKRFLIVYGASLLGGSALVALLGQTDHVIGGASGAVYGMIAAYIVMTLALKRPVQSVLLQAGAWMIAGFFISGIAWQGHLGGAIAGWAVTTVVLRLASRTKAPGPRSA